MNESTIRITIADGITAAYTAIPGCIVVADGQVSNVVCLHEQPTVYMLLEALMAAAEE